MNNNNRTSAGRHGPFPPLCQAQAESKEDDRSLCSEKMISVHQSPKLGLPKVPRVCFCSLNHCHAPHILLKEEKNQFFKSLVPFFAAFFFLNILINNVSDSTFMSVILNTEWAL